MSSVSDIYKQLKSQHNHINHNWWPVSGKFTPAQLEICIGAILTQNTSWRNVEKALANIIEAKMLSAESISKTSLPVLQKLIRPAGFYRQKSRSIKAFCELVAGFDGFYKNVTREQLLALKGIGRETADAILLYACNKPYFVIDTYTRRLLLRKNMISGKESYEELRGMFEKTLAKDAKLYKEFHALIVEIGKRRPKKLLKFVGIL